MTTLTLTICVTSKINQRDDLQFVVILIIFLQKLQNDYLHIINWRCNFFKNWSTTKDLQYNDPRPQPHFAKCPEKQLTKKLSKTKICKIVIHNGNIQTSQAVLHKRPGKSSWKVNHVVLVFCLFCLCCLVLTIYFISFVLLSSYSSIQSLGW